MRILMIAPTPFFSDRGGHVRILEELKAVKTAGHHPVVFTYHLGKEVFPFETRRTITIPWYKKREAGPSYHKLYLDILLFFKVWFSLVTEKWDIIHAHLHEGVWIAGFARFFAFKKTPILFDYQGSLVKEMQDHGYLQNRILTVLFTKIERWCNGFADLIVTSSTNAAEFLHRNFKESKEHVRTLIDAVDTTQFKPGLDLKEVRKQTKLPKDKKIIVYLGVLSEYQGVGLLIEAIPKVIREYPHAHFLIMGYPNVERYQRLAKKLGVEKSCIFTGRIDYQFAPQFISLGNIAVSFKASETEANGKIYNYMALGLPSVISDTSVNREILGDLGVYTQQNSDAIAEGILSLLNDPKKCEALGKKSVKRVEENHSWNARGKELDQIYHQLIH